MNTVGRLITQQMLAQEIGTFKTRNFRPAQGGSLAGRFSKDTLESERLESTSLINGKRSSVLPGETNANEIK